MTKPTALQIHNTVVFALLVRELKTRFGKYRLGYFWAIFDPMAHVLIISFLYVWGFRASQISGISAPLLVLTGIVPFDLFRNTVVACLRSVEANLGLFTYRRVKPSDDVTARVLLELLIAIFAFLILLAAFAYFGYSVDVRNLLGVIYTFAMLMLFSAGVGFIACVVGPTYPEIAKLVPIMIRPLYWISGVFYAADNIPDSMRKYVLFNPLLHATELIRVNLFKSFTSTSGSYTYLTGSVLVTFFIGLAYYRKHRIDIITTQNR